MGQILALELGKLGTCTSKEAEGKWKTKERGRGETGGERGGDISVFSREMNAVNPSYNGKKNQVLF